MNRLERHPDTAQGVCVCACVRVPVCVPVCVCSGPAALDEAGVQAHVSDVVAVQQPCEEALQTQTVPPVGTGAVLPLETHTHTHTG